MGHLVVQLAPGEKFYSEGGAMSFLDPSVEIQPRLLGGFLKGIGRKLFGGESLFLSEYTATRAGKVGIAPGHLGAVEECDLKGNTIMLTSGSYLAHTKAVNLSVRFGGLRSFFSGEGVCLIECSGVGKVFFNTYGAMVCREVRGALTVDTGHVVAFEPTLDYTIGGMGGIKQTLFSGEGLVMKFRGNGKIWLQSRTVGALAGWLRPYCR